MVKIVLGDREKLDHPTTLENVKEIQSTSELTSDDSVVHVLAYTEENMAACNKPNYTLYVPASAFPFEAVTKANVAVYCDIENYPFYQSAKEIIEERANQKKPKGVFRFRRTVKAADADQLFATDLYAIYALLGEPAHVHVTRTNQTNNPAHTIVLIDFGGGTLAHVEYTISDENRIELEWSGIGSIIEFDSNELNPFNPITKTKLPLLYSVDSILQTAHKLDDSLKEKLVDIKDSLHGGGQE